MWWFCWMVRMLAAIYVFCQGTNILATSPGWSLQTSLSRFPKAHQPLLRCCCCCCPDDNLGQHWCHGTGLQKLSIHPVWRQKYLKVPMWPKYLCLVFCQDMNILVTYPGWSLSMSPKAPRTSSNDNSVPDSWPLKLVVVVVVALMFLLFLLLFCYSVCVVVDIVVVILKW